MYWPLIAGFVGVVLVTLLLGWLTDTSRRNDIDRH
jgi:F0F1-type ATP synthase assembly protein I